MIRVPDCHPDRKQKGGNGLCKTCYNREWFRKHQSVNKGEPRVYEHRDITGQRFGRWLALELAEGRYKHGGRLWLCECQCESKTRKALGLVSLTRTTGATKSCGCIEHSQNLRPYLALYRRLKRNDAARICPKGVNLAYEEFLGFTKQDKCHYCLDAIRWIIRNAEKGGGYWLDRKNNNLPYSLDNCVVCCKRCNYAKSCHFSYEEWYGMTAYFRETGICPLTRP